jgi:uncharacterized membrane protein YtjA (UPF0391 family)
MAPGGRQDNEVGAAGDGAAFPGNLAERSDVLGKASHAARQRETERPMLYWAIVFFIIAVVAGVFGFGGVESAVSKISEVLFFVFLVIFLIALVMGLARRRGPTI